MKRSAASSSSVLHYGRAAVGFRAAVALGLLAGRGSAQAAPASERTRHGDTTLVHTTGAGAWGTSQTAVDVLQVGGKSGPIQLGLVTSIAATTDGGVVAFDALGPNGPIMLQFDSTGRLLHAMGRRGAGPGEFRGNARYMTATTDGAVVLRDGQQARLTRYSLDGKYLATVVSPLISPYPFEIAAGPRGSVYLRITGARRDEGERIAWFNAAGELLQTIDAPTLWYSTVKTMTFAPRALWTMLPDGRVVAARSDRIGVLIFPARRGTPLIWTDIPVRAVPFPADERADLQAYYDWFNTNDRADLGPDAVSVPADKPLITALLTDIDDRIWLRRSVPGVRRHDVVEERGAGPPSIHYHEPWTLEAFEEGGAFLGEVQFPADVLQLSIAGSAAWALVRNPDLGDELVRFRFATTAHR